MRKLPGVDYLLLSHEESVNEAPLVVSVQGFEVFYESGLDEVLCFFHVPHKGFVVLHEESEQWEHVVNLHGVERARKGEQLLSR